MHRTETEQASNKGLSPRGRAILSRRLRDGVFASKISFYSQALLHLPDRNTGYLRPAFMTEFLCSDWLPQEADPMAGKIRQ